MTQAGTDTEKIALVRKSIEAFDRGGISAAAEYFDDDIELQSSGLITSAATYRGKSEVIDYVKRVEGALDDIRWKALELIECPEAIVACIRVTGHGGKLDLIIASGYWIRDGKIVRIRSWHSREAALRELR